MIDAGFTEEAVRMADQYEGSRALFSAVSDRNFDQLEAWSPAGTPPPLVFGLVQLSIFMVSTPPRMDFAPPPAEWVLPVRPRHLWVAASQSFGCGTTGGAGSSHPELRVQGTGARNGLLFFCGELIVKNALIIFIARLVASFKTRTAALARMARGASAAPVGRWEQHHAVQKIFQAWRPVAEAYNYYLGPTALAATLAVLLGLAAYWSLDMWTHIWGIYLSVFFFFAFIIAGYHATAKNYGPALITPTRWHAAHDNLRISGDSEAGPMGLLLLLVLLVVLAIDGAFCGVSVISYFENLLTPAQSRAGAVVWGAAVTLMAWHLVAAAAHESVVEARRKVCAQLIDSPLPAQQVMGEKMLMRLAHVIGNDVHRPRARVGKRISLAIAVLLMAMGTFVMRTPSFDAAGGEMKPARMHAASLQAGELRPDGESPHLDSSRLVGSAMLSAFYLLSVLAVFHVRRRHTMVSAESHVDHQVVATFDSDAELIAAHMRHFKSVAARADERLAVFAAEVTKVRTTLAPQHRDRLPDVRVTFLQLCAEQPRTAPHSAPEGEGQ